MIPDYHHRWSGIMRGSGHVVVAGAAGARKEYGGFDYGHIMDSHRAYGQYSTSINPSNQNNGLPVPAAFMLRNTHQVDESKRARFTQLLKQRMELFWNQQMMEIQNASDLRSLQQLPLSRIRRIIKSDPDVRMISGETPILFAKACELFIIELTLRAWLHAEDNKRPTLQRSDIARAIRDADVLDFLDDVVSLDEHKVEVPTNNPEENGFDPTTQIMMQSYLEPRDEVSFK